MTAYRDERDTARNARRLAVARLAAIEAELATIPGWLLVGDPDRLVDDTQRNLATHGAALGADLDEIHRGIAALDAELDILDASTPSQIRRFLEWSRWLEALNDAEQLLEELVPDPRRRFLAATPAMTPDTAQRIIDAISANGGKVGSGDPFVAAAALTDDDVFDLEHTAVRNLDPLPDGHVIGVLLPMRLETRYRRPKNPDDPDDPWRLRVRAHPDPVAFAGLPLPANELEATLVATCWTNADGDLGTAQGKAAFRALAAAVGGGRAVQLLSSVPVVPSVDGFEPPSSYDPPAGRRSEHRAALPDTLELRGDWGTGLQWLGELHPDHAAISAQADMAASMADLRPDQVPEVWWTSYAAAEQVGLAIEVPLPGGPHLDLLMLTGLSDIDGAEVFAAHAGHGDLGVVTPMSPSNTIAGQPAAELGRDPDTWLEVARRPGGSTGAGLAMALTDRPGLSGMPSADTELLDAVPPLVAALWPLLWQRWLKDVEHATQIYEMGDWAARLLAPLGPFPSLRIGSVPYGVLPAVDVTAWVTARHDPAWEEAISFVAKLLLDQLSAAGVAGGTAVGADPERLLDIIGRVPTSRQLGSRQFVPLEVMAMFRAIVNGDPSQQVVDEWEAMAAAALAIEPRPTRRYQPFEVVQPAVDGSASLRDLVEQFLQEPAESLANLGRTLERDAPLLARLIRHSLLLTMAEASRLDQDFPGNWRSPYEIPLYGAGKLAADSGFASPMEALPSPAEEVLSRHPPDPRAVAIARQFNDVREAARRLAELDDALRPEGPLAAAVAAVVDASSHRFDPWITAVGTRRLRRLIDRDVPRRIGAYGWVDDLGPANDLTPPTAAGFIHAPGHAQALAAAVLRDHAISDDDPRWRMNVQSDLARLAARLSGDVRLGVHPSEAIGREVERRAGDPALVLELRRRFPARPEWAGRRVCDGLRILETPTASLPPGLGPLDDLQRVLDAYGDLLVADAVHDVVSGRGASAQESMEAAAGLGAPAELRLLKTRREGSSVRTTVLVALAPGDPDPASPVSLADPALAALLSAELGPATAWIWTAADATVSLADLGLDVADVVLHPQPRLDDWAAAALGAPVTGGSAVAMRRALDDVSSLLGIQQGLPEAADDGTGADQLRARLTTLRAEATTIAGLLDGDPTAGRRWGLPDGATKVLEARIAAAGTAATDATADATVLGERIRALLGPVSGLPLVCLGSAPTVTPAADLDQRWLEIVAAVRPALARLEAHQLQIPWPAAATDPNRLWTVPQPSQHDVVIYGPAVGRPDPVGLALLDSWAETVPGRRHTTHAAFGFDAPRARAPQAILLAIPPDEKKPLTAEALPGIVASTRLQARARMVQPDGLGPWVLAVPSSMVLTTGPAGTDLVGER